MTLSCGSLRPHNPHDWLGPTTTDVHTCPGTPTPTPDTPTPEGVASVGRVACEELDLADPTPAEAELAEALAARMAREATDLRRMAPAANGICHRCGSGLLDATGDHIRNDGCTSVPDQPDGIDETTNTVPDPARAADRVNAWLCEWGDGLIDVTAGTPLYARDLAVLADMSKAGRDAARRDGAADALRWAAAHWACEADVDDDGDHVDGDHEERAELRRWADEIARGVLTIPTETAEESAAIVDANLRNAGSAGLPPWQPPTCHMVHQSSSGAWHCQCGCVASTWAGMAAHLADVTPQGDEAAAQLHWLAAWLDQHVPARWHHGGTPVRIAIDMLAAWSDRGRLATELDRVRGELERVCSERDGVRAELARMAGDLDDRDATLAMRTGQLQDARTRIEELADLPATLRALLGDGDIATADEAAEVVSARLAGLEQQRGQARRTAPSACGALAPADDPDDHECDLGACHSGPHECAGCGGTWHDAPPADTAGGSQT